MILVWVGTSCYSHDKKIEDITYKKIEVSLWYRTFSVVTEGHANLLVKNVSEKIHESATNLTLNLNEGGGCNSIMQRSKKP